MILNEYWTLPTGRYAQLSGKQARPRLGLGVTRASLAALLLCLLAPLLAPPEALAQSGGTGLTISANETEFPESTAEDPRRPQVVLSASDVGGTATRLTLEPSLDSGQFTLGASSPSSGDRITATLSFIDPPDYENPTDAATPVGDAARDNIYLVDVTLNVRSGGSDERPTDTTRIRIRITPVDEYDPVLTNDRTHHRVNENIRGYFVQFHSTDADADGGPIRHEIVDDPVASPDRAHFRLVAFGTPGEVLYFRLPPDYEAPNDEGRDNIYNITVRATSGSPPRTSEPLALTIEISDNRREKSVIVNTRGTVVQNRTYEFRTGYAGVIDTFTIEGGDAGAFSFNPLEVQLGRTADLSSFRFNPSSGELSFSGPAPNATSNLRLSATNTSGRTVFASFSVRANHRAFGIRTGQRFPLPENSDPPQVQFTVTDPDDVPPHVRLFDSWDADLFTLESTSSGGTVTATLRFKTQPDFENPIDTEVTPNRLNPTNDAARNNIYLVRIGITEEVDSNGFVGAGYDVRIVVTNVDDGPTLFATEPTYEVPENTTEPIVTLRGIDADADTLRYEIVDGAASPDRDHFFLHRSTGVLRFASAQNFEEPSDAGGDGTYHITVQIASGNPSRASNRQTLEITLTDGDDRVPVLTTTQATYEAPENTTDLIATLQGESVDGGGLRFEIAEGDTLSPDRAHFDLDPLSGELRFKDPQDFEAPSDVDGNGTYHIAVQATSSNPPRTSSPLALAITLTDDDDNDPTITPTQATYNFLTETMGTIATFTIEDDDADEARAFSALEAVPASGTNLTAFDFDPGSGVLSFQDPAVNATSRLIIRGTSGDKTAMLAITIAVMSDSPPVFAATEFTLPEDRNPPQVMLSATDADGATVTLTLTNTQDSTLFTLEDGSSTGGTTTANLRFIDPPDFEAPADTATAGGDAAGNNIYLVRVRAKSMNLDGVVVRTNETIRITVTNIDDNPPTLTNTETDHPVAEGRTDTFLTLVGSDADEDDSVRFTKSGGADVAHFTLDGTSGALRFASAPDFENPRGTPLSSDNTNTYHLSVQAESGTGQTTKTSPALALTIRVTPVDEDTPRITASTGLTTYNFLTGTTGPIATFTIEDSDAGEAHAFSALEAGPASGTDLADFSFNTDTGVLSFQGSASVGTSALIIRGTSNTKPAMLAITIRVADELVLNAPVNQNYTMDTAITDLALPEATGGTAPLTYTLTSVPGLTFAPDTRTLSGTPDTAGTTTLTYEVMDANGANTNATFTVTVNASLTLTASGDQNYTQGRAITDLPLPAATGGTAPLIYTLTSVPGLTFTADTRILSGTPNTPATTTLTYTVTDANGANTNATFTVTVNASLTLTASGDQNYTQGRAITDLPLPAATGGTAPLIYTLTSVPGLTFTADTRILSGTPNTAATTTLTYTVTDANGASENATFTVTVNASLTLTASGDQNYTQGRAITDLPLPAATGGTAPLIYTLTSVPGLTFTADTRILSGTPNTAATTTLTYTVTDANGASENATFMVIVNAGLALSARGNQNYTLDTEIDDLTLPAATGGKAPLTYTLTSVPGLNFNANTRRLSGTPDTAATTTLTYEVMDANGTNTNATFTVTVNASLALTASGNQNYTLGTTIPDLQLPAATGGTAPLTYTLFRPGDGALPGGLNFNANTRTLSGTPTTAGASALTYRVSDANGASTSVGFTVIVNASLALTASGNQNYTQGAAITALTLPAATGGTAPLTYTLTGPGGLPGGLEFDADTRTLSGTLANTASTFDLTYEVTDDNGASTNATFRVVIALRLRLSAPVNQNYTQGTLITGLELPEARGGREPLTYTLTGPGDSALPGGLTFTPDTRILSGTPNTAATTTLTYTVTDANGANTSVDFTVTVNDGLALTASGNQNYTLDTAITDLQLPVATGGTGTLQYTLTGPGGSALPGGLEFDPGTRTLSGTPNTAATTTLTYEVTDDNGASTNATFTVIVSDGLALSARGNQNYTRGTLIPNLPLPEATGGTAPLTYTLAGPGDSALPGGLTFTPGTRTLSGTPSMAATTTLTYRVTDTNGASTTATFMVTVNASLTLTASGNQNYTLGTAITALELPVAAGGTVPLTYTLTSVPGGLTFTPATRTLSGTPDTDGDFTLTYRVTDDNGASTSVGFMVIVNASLALDTPANQNYTRGTAITDLELPVAAGGTAPLTYTLTSVPGLEFDANNRTLSGTPNTAATTELTYTATDDNGSTAMDTFTVTVADEVEVTAPGDQTYTMDTAITDLSLPMATGGTGTVTYTLAPLPDGLTFTAGTRVLSGTPTTADTTELTYIATDDNGSTAMDTFTVIVAAGVAVTAPNDQTYTMDTAITDLTLDPATGGTTPVTYTLAPLPNGLLFNATTRVLSGTPNTTATTVLTYTATDDNGSTAMDTFTVTVADEVEVTAPGDQTYTMGTAITALTLTPATGGTTPVTYTLAPLPNGLLFNATTRVLSGTPNTTATTVLTYTATDDNGSTAMDTFTVTVADEVEVTAPGDQTYTMDTAITDLTLPEAAGGTAPLTYTLTSVPGLNFIPGTRTLSGTPTTADTTELTYEVTDTNGASTNATFTVTVNASLTLTASGNQTYTMDTAITALSLPMTTGGTEPLTYTLTGPGDSALPGGLSFNANTRTLSGTPSTADTTTLTYEVTDTNGASTNATFTVTVNASLTLDTPDDQNYTMDTAITDLTLDPATGGTTPVTYTLTGPSGAALATAIPGLNFDANNRTLSGTPNTTATTVLTYTATDDNGSTAMDTFTVTVADEVEVTAPGDQTYTMDTAITDLALAPATGGTGAVTYTLTPLPNGLIFNETTRVLSGTPTAMETVTATYTATDDNGSTAMDTLTVIVAAGVAVTAPSDQTYTMGTAITALTLTPATGGTTPVTYTLAPLPNGLLFNATTRVLSGTPNTTATTVLTYTATDDNGSTAMDTFTVTVADEVEVTAPGDQTYTMDTAITDLSLPMATGGTAPLTYTLTGPGDSALPGGLSFNANTRTLSGTPSTPDTTTLTYEVTDNNGANTSVDFTVRVNASLTLDTPDDQNYTMDTAITDLTLDPATGGTTPVTYTLTGPSGAALATAIPGLNFDANNRTLSGTPNTTATTVLTYTATDDNGSTAMDTFTVIVAAGVAVTAPVDQTYTMDTAITALSLPMATGGTEPLTYALTGPGDSALPGGLSFNANTRTLSGAPSTPDTTTLTYEVTDDNGASTSVDFTVIVNASLVLDTPANQNYTMDTAITDLTLDPATGGTTPVTYTLTGPSGAALATAIPGLNFDANNRTLSGTPNTTATTVLTYTATDDNGSTAMDTFTVTVAAGVAVTAPGDQTYTMGTAITDLTLPEAAGGTTPVTYTLAPLPNGLTFTATTRVLSGTPDTDGNFTLTYRVTDDNGASTSVDFTVIVNASLVLDTPANQNYTMDTAITALSLPMATGGTEPLTYTLTGPGDSALPGGLSFNANTRTLSGAPSTADTTTLTYMVTDTNGASTSVDFTVIVNASLTLTASGNQNYTQGRAITALPLPEATGGTAPLTYTLTSVPGLDFDPGTRTLSGTPDMAATTTLTYAVTDDNGASTTATFTVIVSDGLALSARGNQNYTRGTLIPALELPVAAGGTAPLTYTLTSVPGLDFDPGTRILSGTPNTAGTTTLTYEVMDGNGASTSVDFMVIVNDGLTLTASGNQNYTLDTAITDLELPAATGGTGTLTYTLTSVPGLTFTPGTRTLSGTPNTTATTTLTYRVTDTNGASTTATFTVTVNASLTLTASGDQNYTLDTAITALTLPIASGGTAPLTYTLTSVPGLNFTPGSRILSGTPSTPATTTLTYMVGDANNASTTATFTVIVNDGLALTASANQNYTLDTAITALPLPAATGGTGTLTYTLTSVPGLTFNANNRTLSGTPSMAATTTLTYEVTDTNGASTSVDFTVIVSDGLALTASGDQNYTLDTAITGLTLPPATGGTGPLTYTLTSVPGLAFDPGTRILSGTPTTAGTTLLTYMVSDTNGASTSVGFTVMVSDGLALSARGNQNYTLDTEITGLELPAATGGTGTLQYTLTGPGDGNLPAGLDFNANTRILSGTPTTDGTTTLTYEVTDANNASTTATFMVTVNASLTLTASGNQNYTQNTLIPGLELPAATGGTTPVTYTLAPLPDGLTFTASTRVLSGTPTAMETVTATYTAMDSNGASQSTTFTITVADEVEVTAPNDQTYTMDTAITALSLPMATGGTTPVTYTLAPLPNGLAFNVTTRVLSGTPTTADTTELTYTATDDNGSTAMDTFTVIVAARVEVTALNDQTYTMDTAITALSLPMATGGTAPLTYTLASLPDGLAFDANNRTLSGTPTTADTTELTYTATDDNGSTAMDTFTVIVAARVEVTAPGDQTYTMDTAITALSLPMATGGTGTLTYTLTGPGGLPGGLNFNANNRTLSGTPDTAGTFDLTYAVSDTNNASTSVTFTVIVSDGLALSASGDQNYTLDTEITGLQLPAATGGTGTLTYTLTGPSGLPGGLNFNAGTRTLSGTPDTAGTTVLTYEVTDTNGASTSVDFMVMVSDGLALNTPANQNYTQGREIPGLELPVATGGTGTLTYTLTSVPGLNFNANNRTLSGTPDTAGTTTLTYRVTDTNGASTTATFTVTVNASLTLTASGNQNYTQNTLIPGLELPAATGGTTPVTYTLAPLPDGLTFTASTRVLSGTPTAMETVTATYTAMDSNGASQSAIFTITVADEVEVTAPNNQTYTMDTAVTALNLPMATGGTGTLTYTLTGPGGLPAGLTFTPGTRILSGTPDTAATTTLTYAVSDANGASTSVDFTATVNASLTLTASGNQNYTQGRAITALPLPEATGGTAPLTYTLTGPGGGNLPAGLTFNTRTLSGMPDTAGTFDLTYAVSDTNNASTSVTFTVIVSDGLALSASGDQNYTLDTAITALQLPVATGGTVPLTYTLTGPGGSALPAGLTFTPGTRTLSGTPSMVATTTLTYMVTDTNNASTSVDFMVTVNASLTLTASGNQTYTMDTAITALSLPMATGGTGTLTYTLTGPGDSALPAGLTFNTRTLSGTPTTAGTTLLTYMVSDTNSASTTATFTVTVNASLTLTASGDQNYTRSTAITDLTLPEATGGTGTLTYTLTGPGDSALPAGLTFNTRTLSGTPDTPDTFDLTYRVSDANGASTSVDFMVMVNASLALTASGDQNYTLDTEITGLELPVATGGTGTLTYTLTGPGDSALPAGLTFNTRTLSGTPNTAGTTTLTYMVTDTNNASTSVDFTVMVNDGLALTAPANQNYTLDTAITDLTLPEVSGGTGTLTYTLTGPGDSALPAGLTFNTRTLSGTPNTAGTTTLTYMVTDTNNASTSVDFTVTVNASLALTAPANQNYTLDTEIPGLELPVATGGTGIVTYTLAPLPNGLIFNATTRVLSGTPTTADTTELTYIATDDNGSTAMDTFTITVDNADAPPAFVETTFSQVENTTPTLTLAATEADGDDVSFTLQSDGDATYFTLTDGGAAANTATLIFRDAPNFESPQGATLLAGDDGIKNTYQMNVQAASTTSPNAERTTTQIITINVTDADDPPTFTTAASALTIMEGDTTMTAMIEAIDQDGDSVTLALTGGADQARLRLTGATLSFISTPDFETPTDADANNIYEAEITASSTSSTGFTATDTATGSTATGATALSAVRTFNITVTDADDNAPELTSSTTFQIQSGETAVATLEATDADSGDTETIVFALSGGADQNQFALTRAGVLSFTSAADFTEPTDADADNIYEAEITLTSGSRPHTTQAALEIEVISIDRQSRRRIGNVILAHIARSLADNTQDTILARTSGRLTNNLELSNRQGDLDDLIKGIQGFSFMQRLDAKQAAGDATAAAAAGDADADATTKERGFALWAKGRIRTFSASPNERAINNFSGHTYNLNLGADYQTGALLFGGLITASQSNVKFTSGSAEGQGKIRTKLTTFAPFMHFRLKGGTELWGSASFGQGRMHYQSETTDGGFESTDLKYAQVAGGLYQPLKALKKTNLALRIDGYTARLKADAFEDVFLAMAGDVSRVRGLLEVGYRSQGVGNGVLDAKLNGGARLETGDIGKGVGLEFGVEITYANPASGLSVSADVNAILLHTAQKYRHLDAGLRFLLDPGAKKRGLQFRLEPRIGGGASAAPLWDGALVDGSASPVQQLGTSGLGQLQTALGLSYGFAARQSLLTPFTEMRLDDRGAPIDLMLGVRLSRANHPINITLYTQKVFRNGATGSAFGGGAGLGSNIGVGTTPGVHLKLNWR